MQLPGATRQRGNTTATPTKTATIPKYRGSGGTNPPPTPTTTPAQNTLVNYTRQNQTQPATNNKPQQVQTQPGAQYNARPRQTPPPFVQYQPPGLGMSQQGYNPTNQYDNRQNNDTWGGQFSWTQPAGPSVVNPAYNPSWDYSNGAWPVKRQQPTGISWLDAFQTGNQPGAQHAPTYAQSVYGQPDYAHTPQPHNTAGSNVISGSQAEVVQYTQQQANKRSWEDAWYAATHPYSPLPNEPWTGYQGKGGKTPGQRAGPQTQAPASPPSGGGTASTGSDTPYDYGGGGYGGGGGGGGGAQTPAPWFYGLVSWRF